MIKRNCPPHYRGDGRITCEDAIRSMLAGLENRKDAEGDGKRSVGLMVVKWWTDAAKYVWRWPLKNGEKDVDKAIDCLYRLKAEVNGYDDRGNAQRNLENLIHDNKTLREEVDILRKKIVELGGSYERF